MVLKRGLLSASSRCSAAAPGGQACAQAQLQEEQQAALEEAARGLDADSGVRYWTDYLKMHLHPRSTCLLSGWQDGTSPQGFGEGAAGLESSETREAALDRVRFWAEECDTLQGFQCFVDDQTGFGRLAADLLPDLRDDYGAQPLLLFAVRAQQQPPASSDAAAVCAWRLSAALSMGLLSQQASLYTVVANPSPALPQLARLCWRPGNPFHASALCASVLDSALVACRLAQHPLPCSLGAPIGRTDLQTLASSLAPTPGSNLAALSAAVPCPSLPSEQEAAQQQDSRMRQQASSAAPGSAKGSHAEPLTQSAVASWTPGSPATPAESGYGRGPAVEHVALRGPRQEGAPLQTTAAAQILEASLALEGCRLAARKICVVGGQQVLECSQALCGAKGSGAQLAVVWWGDKAADACVDSGI
eukprot:jgi/Astpho2/7534/fgenesh1_pg.00114_%23_113_t